MPMRPRSQTDRAGQGSVGLWFEGKQLRVSILPGGATNAGQDDPDVIQVKHHDHHAPLPSHGGHHTQTSSHPYQPATSHT